MHAPPVRTRIWLTAVAAVSFVIVLAARHFPSPAAADLSFCASFPHLADASRVIAIELLRQLPVPVELHLLWTSWLPGEASQPAFQFQSGR
jgi:hypothetical protein